MQSFMPSVIIAAAIAIAFLLGRMVSMGGRRFGIVRLSIIAVGAFSLLLLGWMMMNGAPLLVLAIPAAIPVGFLSAPDDALPRIF